MDAAKTLTKIKLIADPFDILIHFEALPDLLTVGQIVPKISLASFVHSANGDGNR